MPDNGFADRDVLLARNQRRFREVSCGDMRVRLQSLSEAERAQVELDSQGDEVRAIRARFIVASVVDADGNRVFRDSDVPNVMELDSQVTGRLGDEISAHIGITDDQFAELAKNSDETPEDDSP